MNEKAVYSSDFITIRRQNINIFIAQNRTYFDMPVGDTNGQFLCHRMMNVPHSLTRGNGLALYTRTVCVAINYA